MKRVFDLDVGKDSILLRGSRFAHAFSEGHKSVAKSVRWRMLRRGVRGGCTGSSTRSDSRRGIRNALKTMSVRRGTDGSGTTCDTFDIALKNALSCVAVGVGARGRSIQNGSSKVRFCATRLLFCVRVGAARFEEDKSSCTYGF